MIVLIALIVVGPERLPGLARQAGLWVGKTKRMLAEIKTEIDQEMADANLQRILDEQDMVEDTYEVIEETKNTAREITSMVKNETPTTTASTPVGNQQADPDTKEP